MNLHIRGVDKNLQTFWKVEAAKAGLTLREYVIQNMPQIPKPLVVVVEQSRTKPPMELETAFRWFDMKPGDWHKMADKNGNTQRRA